MLLKPKQQKLIPGMLFFLKGGSYLVWKFLFNNILIAFFKGYIFLLAELYKKKKQTWYIAKYLY